MVPSLQFSLITYFRLFFIWGIILLSGLLIQFKLSAQVLVQDFDELDDLEQFQANSPDIGQVNSLSLGLKDGQEVYSLAQEDEDDGQYLLINKFPKIHRHLSRTTGINDESFLRISLDFSMLSVSASSITTDTSKFASIVIGDQLFENDKYSEKKERWAQIGILAHKDGGFYLSHEVLDGKNEVISKSMTPKYTNEKGISLIMANTEDGSSVTFMGPDEKTHSIDNGKVQIWIGEDFILEEDALQGESSAINSVKFMLWGTNLSAVARIDNLTITTDTGVDPLPVELLSFSAKVVKEDIQLNWATASEINSSHFNIERSFDGETFETLGQLKAAENSTEKVDYIYLDRDAARKFGGTVYYRLHQVDLDGATEYSPLTLVTLPGLQSISATAFPNPFQEQLQLKFLTDKSILVNIRLLSLQGELLFETQQSIKSSGQEQEYAMPGSGNLPAGIYLLEIANGQEISRYRVMKL